MYDAVGGDPYAKGSIPPRVLTCRACPGGRRRSYPSSLAVSRTRRLGEESPWWWLSPEWAVWCRSVPWLWDCLSVGLVVTGRQTLRVRGSSPPALTICSTDGTVRRCTWIPRAPALAVSACADAYALRARVCASRMAWSACAISARAWSWSALAWPRRPAYDSQANWRISLSSASMAAETAVWVRSWSSISAVSFASWSPRCGQSRVAHGSAPEAQSSVRPQPAHFP